MTDWLMPRYTAAGNRVKWLHFDERQVARRLPDKMAVGDRVLFYQTATLGGPQAVVGSVVITGDLENVPPSESTRRGGRDWSYRRAVTMRVVVPTDRRRLGVPLVTLRKILGWKERATVRQAIRISEDRFDAIEQALVRRLEAAGLSPTASVP